MFMITMRPVSTLLAEISISFIFAIQNFTVLAFKDQEMSFLEEIRMPQMSLELLHFASLKGNRIDRNF